MRALDNWCLDKLGFRPSFTLTAIVLFGGSTYVALWFVAWVVETVLKG